MIVSEVSDFVVKKNLNNFQELSIMKLTAWFLLMFTISCSSIKIKTPSRSSHLTGNQFYKTAASFKWQQRDSFAVKEILSGNIPSFLKKFVPMITGNIKFLFYK